MFRQIAAWIEAIPGLPASKQDSLIATKLVDAVDEFMARVMEELDYQNEAGNMEKFAELYCYRNGTFPDVKVVVPTIHKDMCTSSLLVMQWIEGEKLATVGDPTILDESTRAENLAMVEAGIAATLSQLLGTGLMHADPHTGNLLKVQTDQGLLLGFLDFGMLSTVPENVRDALVCAVAQLVFARDTQAVADLFGELDLIPVSVLNDPTERLALAQALDAVFRDILLYPDDASADGTTLVPVLRFDKLLAGLSLLVARFRFTLPPYFLNNARALGTLEGLARKLDPSFNALQALYPYALNRILRNPSMSPIVEHTLLSLIRNRASGKFDRDRIRKLLADTCLLSGRSRGQLIADVLSSKSGLKIAQIAAKESILYGMHENQRRRRLLFQL
jgi:predicted unusual protein kinase regulating ubiquinone biosynthesis (AarF/ABC1/UbiB family)